MIFNINLSVEDYNVDNGADNNYKNTRHANNYKVLSENPDLQQGNVLMFN